MEYIQGERGLLSVIISLYHGLCNILTNFHELKKSTKKVRRTFLSYAWQQKSPTFLYSHKMSDFPTLTFMSWGQKPQLWCLRIVPCFALPQSSQLFAYRGIIIPLLGSYWGGSQGLSSTYEQAHVDLDLLTLASYNYIIRSREIWSREREDRFR